MGESLKESLRSRLSCNTTKQPTIQQSSRQLLQIVLGSVGLGACLACSLLAGMFRYHMYRYRPNYNFVLFEPHRDFSPVLLSIMWLLIGVGEYTSAIQIKAKVFCQVVITVISLPLTVGSFNSTFGTMNAIQKCQQQGVWLQDNSALCRGDTYLSKYSGSCRVQLFGEHLDFGISNKHAFFCSQDWFSVWYCCEALLMLTCSTGSVLNMVHALWTINCQLKTKHNTVTAE